MIEDARKNYKTYGEKGTKKVQKKNVQSTVKYRRGNNRSRPGRYHPGSGSPMSG